MIEPSAAVAGASGLGATAIALLAWFGRNFISDWIEERRQLRTARIQERMAPFQFLQTHMRQDVEERAKLIEVLTRLGDTMSATKDEIVANRVEQRERTAVIHERLNEIHLDVARSICRSSGVIPPNGKA